MHHTKMNRYRNNIRVFLFFLSHSKQVFTTRLFRLKPRLSDACTNDLEKSHIIRFWTLFSDALYVVLYTHLFYIAQLQHCLKYIDHPCVCRRSTHTSIYISVISSHYRMYIQHIYIQIIVYYRRSFYSQNSFQHCSETGVRLYRYYFDIVESK